MACGTIVISKITEQAAINTPPVKIGHVIFIKFIPVLRIATISLLRCNWPRESNVAMNIAIGIDIGNEPIASIPEYLSNEITGIPAFMKNKKFL